MPAATTMFGIAGAPAARRCAWTLGTGHLGPDTWDRAPETGHLGPSGHGRQNWIGLASRRSIRGKLYLRGRNAHQAQRSAEASAEIYTPAPS